MSLERLKLVVKFCTRVGYITSPVTYGRQITTQSCWSTRLLYRVTLC